MKIIFLCVLSLSSLASAKIIDQIKVLACHFKCDHLPDSNDILFSFGDSKNETISKSFSMLFWNIYKARADNFVRAYRKYSADVDFVMLQEMNLESSIKDLLLEKENSNWNMATSFYMSNDIRTGVITGSAVKPVDVQYSITKDLEPLVKAPKATVLTTYAIGNGKEVLIINIHGINFKKDDGLTRQLEEIEPMIKAHEGPIVFGGDFNSKNDNRLKILNDFMSKYGMNAVTFENPQDGAMDSGNLLDHVFMRGLITKRARFIKDATASDHPAMIVEFEN